MSEQKTNMHEEFRAQTSGRGRARGQVLFYQFLILITGAVLTVWAFVSINTYIQSLKSDEYNRMSLEIADEISDHFSEQLSRLVNTSSFLSIENTAFRQTAIQKARRALGGSEGLEQVVWVFKGPDGRWVSEILYAKLDGRRYGLNMDRDFFADIERKNMMQAAKNAVLLDVSFTVQSGPPTGEDHIMRGVPFVISVPLERPSQNGLLMAVISPHFIFDQNWQQAHGLSAFLSIRDMASGQSIFALDKTQGTERALQGKTFVYEFPVIDRNWEVSMKFFRLAHERFMGILPLCVLVLGCLTTALAAAFTRIYNQHEERMEDVSQLLERKSVQLDNEIAERKRIGAVLERSEHEHRSIVDAVTDIIFETDANGRIVFLNERWRAVTGFDPQQSKGMDLFSMLDSNDQERLRQDFQEMLQGTSNGFRSFTRLRTADGKFRAVELAVSMTRKDENRETRVVGTFTDVEERRRAERALSEAEKKYRAIVENAAGGIFQITPEGLYLSANPALARILGYESAEELLRTVKNANEQVYASQRERQMFLKELEKHGYMHNYETRVVCKDGEILWINENARAVRDENMHTLYYEGSMSDITERKEADIKLREAKIHSDMANRAKSEFLANMSHELRTPLNSIIGFSEIIKDEAFGKIEPESYLEYARDIHSSGAHLLDIINEILDISKIETGERQLNESLVDLNEIVLGCLELVKNKVEVNKLHVTTELQDIPDVIAEELAMKQVILNLLSNAVKFTPKGGRISITSAQDAGGRLSVSITDTGIGLNEDEIQKALSPFGQLQNELSRDNSGTGLGLTLADELVKMHGGELEMISQKGIGTTVTVIMPATRVSKKKKSRPATPVKKSESEDQESA